MKCATPTDTSKKRGCLTRLLIFFVIYGGIGFCVFLTIFSIWRWELRRSVNAQIASIKAAGYPVNWEDLAKWPVEVPDAENAAFGYAEAISHVESEEIRAIQKSMPKRNDLLTDKTRKQLELIVQTNREAIELAEAVTNAGESRYPIEYEDGPTAQLPHLAGLKELAIALECKAIMDATKADATGASRAIKSSLDVSKSLNNEPFLISQLTSAAILTISSESLENVLCRTTLSPDQLARLEEQFSEAETNNRFVTGLIGERAVTGEIIRLAQDDVRKLVKISNRGASPDNQTEMPWRNPGFGWRFIGLWERDRNFFLQAMATNIFLIQQGPPASLAVSNVSAEILTKARKGFYVFSAMLLPGMSAVAKKDASTRARLRTAIAALAMERWRAAHDGAVPETLDKLVPQFLPSVPADPFDGKTIRFKKLENGYCIYSVGPNQQDDGGKDMLPPSAKLPKEEWNAYDIVFKVER